MRLRHFFFIALALGAGLAVVTSCTSFDGTPSRSIEPDASDDVGADASGIGADAASPPPANLDAATVDAAPPVDAGPCGHCRSLHCSDAGACEPLVFVTGENFAGDLGAVDGGPKGLARGDEICAKAAGAPGVFRAWLSDGAQNAITHVTSGGVTNRPLWRADGKQVALSLDSLISTNKPLNAIDRTATNGTVPLLKVWTGTSVDGTVTSATCSSWTSASSGTGHIGYTQASVHWTLYQVLPNYQSCALPAPLYCFEVVPP